MYAKTKLRKRPRISYIERPAVSTDETENVPDASTVTIVNSRRPKSKNKFGANCKVVGIGVYSKNAAPNLSGYVNNMVTEHNGENLVSSASKSDNKEHNHPIDGKYNSVAIPTFKETESPAMQTHWNISDFIPIAVVTTTIPDLFNEKFPKPMVKEKKYAYVCQWCEQNQSKVNYAGFETDKHNNLIHHLKKFHSDIPIQSYNVQCQTCKAYFYHTDQLRKHNNQGSCYLQGGMTRDVDQSRCLNDVSNSGMQVCPWCDMIFLSRSRYHKHINSSDEVVNGCKFEDFDHPMEMGMFDYLKCKFCRAMFLHEIDYKDHIKPFPIIEGQRENLADFKCKGVSNPLRSCSVCSQWYKSKGTFKEHISSDHTIEEFGIKCDKCGKYFYSKSALEEHSRSNKMVSVCINIEKCRTIPELFLPNGRYPCPACEFQTFHSRKSRSRIRLHRHLMAYHPDFKSKWVCPKCKMIFVTQQDYDDHMTKWKCPLCEKEFSTKRLLHDHCFQSTAHLVRPSYVKSLKMVTCNVCQTRVENSRLKHHMKNIHSCLQSCPLCEATADEHPNMLKHIYTAHAYKKPKIKKFLCTMCDNKTALYVNKQQLNRHIAAVHNKEEEAACDICNKKFAQKATMLRHRRIHLDIKPFKCGICELSFTQRTAMKSHRARHYNADGTLKTEDEIKCQVEVIKQQREKASEHSTKKAKKKTKK